MNGKPAYEQLITDKLNSLPVPNMADAIWTRIEAQLDIDMPTDDGGGDSPAPQSPSGGGNLLGGIGVFIGIIALVTFFIINKNNKQNNVQPRISLPTTEVIQPDSTPPGKAPPDNSRTNPVTQQEQVEHTGPLQTFPDTALVGTVLSPVIDSAVAGNTPIVQPPPVTMAPAASDTTVPKKKRGVQLNDADYRIVPKKDSLP